jgi:hypothetical protein
MRAMVEADVRGRWKHDLAVAALVAFSSSITALYGQAAPSTDEQDKALAGIKEYALNYARSLPDYTCIRVTQQKSSAVIAIKEELTVAGNRESYKVLTTENHFPRGVKFADEDFGTISVGEFSAVLGRIFAPDTGASFGWAGSSKLRGRPVLVFSFEVPAAHGALVLDGVERRELVEGYRGLIYADAESKAVLRVETHMSDFFPESKFSGIDLTLDYKAAKIGEREFVLPYRFDLERHQAILISMPGATRSPLREGPGLAVTAEYQNYHGYSAQSAVGFGEADSRNDVHSAITFGEIIPPEKRQATSAGIFRPSIRP